MKKFEAQDWYFEIDFEKTQAYYANKTTSNYYDLIRFPDTLITFLKNCGINHQKSTASGLYFVYGTASSETKYELDFYGKNTFASAVLYFDNPLNPSSFTIEIFV